MVVYPPWPVPVPATPPQTPATEPTGGGAAAPVPATEPADGAPQVGTEFIRWVQHSLNLILDLQLPVDGIMTPETRQGIRDFQLRRGFIADGIVGPETQQAIIAERQKIAARSRELELESHYFAAADSPSFGQTGVELEAFDTESAGEEAEVSRSSPEYIRWVQTSLNQILRLRLAVDGISGPQTRSAIRSFQLRQGLTVDGIVGPQTEAALISAGASPPPQAAGGPSGPRSRPEYIRWVQTSLNQILGLRLAVDGIIGPQTRSAIRTFQQRQGLTVDGIVGPLTEAALVAAGASPPPGITPAPTPGPTPTPWPAPTPGPSPSGAVDWTQVPQKDRMVYVMRRLIEHYGFPENAAAGLVGNLSAESGLLPNRVEQSGMATPMRAPDFNGRITDFTAEQIMNRSSQRRQGPRAPGIGLAQWTTAARRTGLFQHNNEGQQLGAAILFDMDAQIDYLVHELRTLFPRLYALLMNPGVSLAGACDEVLYSFEVPGSILRPPDPTTGRRQRLPRDDPRVQAKFRERRPPAGRALQFYRQATQGM